MGTRPHIIHVPRMEWLIWLESLPLSVWVRESGSLWSYPTVLFLHTIGLAFAVGMSAVISLRVLGVAAEMPLAPLEGFYRILWMGFWVNAASGVALLIADATTKLTNPVFFIKMICVVLAMGSMGLIRRSLRAQVSGSGPVSRQIKMLAWLSLVVWTGAILAGRLMAYIGPVSGVVRS
jgi:hypothetical protein